jgi:hypothetical protein
MQSLHSKVSIGIFVGNIYSATDLTFLAEADVSAIINISGKSSPIIEDVDTFDFLLPSQELMDTEFPKTYMKLEAISQTIHNLRQSDRNILVCCNDGINKSILAIGHYLITYGGMEYGDIIEYLESIYFAQKNTIKCLTMVSFRKILRQTQLNKPS